MKPTTTATLLCIGTLLAGCAGLDTVLHSNVATPYIYSASEKAPGPLSASYQWGATGEVSYCNAGMSSLIASRRKDALDAVARVCQGDYSITGEGGGGALGHRVGNFKLTPDCYQGRTVVFKCSKVQPAPTASVRN
jgi:hypothetical protein